MYLRTHFFCPLLHLYPEQQISVLFMLQHFIKFAMLILHLHELQNWAYDKCVQNGNLFGEDSCLIIAL